MADQGGKDSADALSEDPEGEATAVHEPSTGSAATPALESDVEAGSPIGRDPQVAATSSGVDTAQSEQDDLDRLFGEGDGAFGGLSAAWWRRPARRDRNSRTMAGIAVLTVLALVCVGLVVAVIFKNRADADAAAQEAAAYTPPAFSGTAPSGGRAVVAVVGDETASRGATGVGSSRRWPALLADATGAKVVLSTSVGAGYVTAGTSGKTFVQAASDVPADASVVLFVGGEADRSEPALNLAKAATRAYAAASRRAPDATIVAVGPLFRTSGTAADSLSKIDEVLRSAAGIAEVRWFDPVAADWLDGVKNTGDLGGEAQRSIASRMRAVVEEALG